jgi:membrane protein
MISPALLLSDGQHFVQLVWQRFNLHGARQHAVSLTYTTLLSLVPLLTIILAVLAAFPIADRMGLLIQDFVFENFIPTAGDVIQEHLNAFTANAAKLSGISFAFLVLVAFLMMRDIDRALNAIWESRNRRSMISNFLIYWALLTLGPILLAVSFAISSYLVSLPLWQEAEQAFDIRRRFIGITPVLFSAVAFMLMYLIIPNKPVRLRDALIGALVAAILFEIAKRGFAFYLTTFPTYVAIYGAVAIIPIFLIWVYLSWIIFLLGAEVAHSLDLFRHRARCVTGETHAVAEVLTLLATLNHGQQSGQPLTLDQLSKGDMHSLGRERIDQLLLQLTEENLLAQTEQGEWVLTQDLKTLSLHALLLRLHLPVNALEADAGNSMAEQLQLLRQRVRQDLDMSVAELIEQPVKNTN